MRAPRRISRASSFTLAKNKYLFYDKPFAMYVDYDMPETLLSSNVLKTLDIFEAPDEIPIYEPEGCSLQLSADLLGERASGSDSCECSTQACEEIQHGVVEQADDETLSDHALGSELTEVHHSDPEVNHSDPEVHHSDPEVLVIETMPNFAAMPLRDLKKECLIRKVSSAGKRDVIILRLQAWHAERSAES